MLIQALRQNHPEFPIKKLQVLGKGFYPQIGKPNTTIPPQN